MANMHSFTLLSQIAGVVDRQIKVVAFEVIRITGAFEVKLSVELHYDGLRPRVL